MPIWVVLWTDGLLFLLLLAGLGYTVWVRRDPPARARWGLVLRTPSAAASACLLACFIVIALIDSVHLRLPVDSASRRQVYATQTVSALDLLLQAWLPGREKTYSAPLAYQQWTKETLSLPGKNLRDFPRLQHGGRHLAGGQEIAALTPAAQGQLAAEWSDDVMRRARGGLMLGFLLALSGSGVMLAVWSQQSGLSLKQILSEWTQPPESLHAQSAPWPARRAVLVTLGLLLCLAGIIGSLGTHYHVLGTDRTGNDVLVQALKSLRTAWVIGLITTLSMLPLALSLGLMAGYFKGWVDDVIQYFYTTLSSIPGVLLIAACVLMIQVAIDAHADWFQTSAERSDVRLLMLCLVLGLTGWAGLCRLLRGETLKLRELEFVQAARAFGVSHARILWRHLLPNVAHLVLITIVLEFSGLVLYEAVLSYIGVGVDVGTNSFGGMINLARLEMTGSRMIWWNLLTAFGFMLALVLAANVLSDAVRAAFDPRSARFRPQRLPALVGSSTPKTTT